ncbi:hypothetical protein DERP_007111 [Dermatophagoides pteronyssinus]|uniref:Uncharacterized protein n=1 Tax=Dermatophagoides pteronyssinus TaxID=6956 RepID=A0ABQ8JU68_DERPT|nr:hypothetical protein DERP_007111 [Dermatophagoides pteronyssinus]
MDKNRNNLLFIHIKIRTNEDVDDADADENDRYIHCDDDNFNVFLLFEHNCRKSKQLIMDFEQQQQQQVNKLINSQVEKIKIEDLNR